MVTERPPPDTLDGRSVKTDCAWLFSKVLPETVTTEQLYMLTGPWVKSLGVSGKGERGGRKGSAHCCTTCFCIRIGQTDCEQNRSRINNNRLQDVSATQGFVSCVLSFVHSWQRPKWLKCPAVSCYWFWNVSAHNQFAQYWQCSNEPLRHHRYSSHVLVHGVGKGYTFLFGYW